MMSVEGLSKEEEEEEEEGRREMPVLDQSAHIYFRSRVFSPDCILALHSQLVW